MKRTNAWEQRKLGDIVKVCSGKDYKHLGEGDIPVYGTSGYMLNDRTVKTLITKIAEDLVFRHTLGKIKI